MADLKGGTGMVIMGGSYLDRDRKSIFRDRKQFGTHREYGDLDAMLATDLICKLIMRGVADVIYQAQPDVICPEGCPQDAADLVERQLLTDLHQGFTSFLKEAAYGAPWNGHLPFEEQWGEAGGEIQIQRFHARYPWTIQKWDVDQGRLRGITQWTVRDGAWGEFPIPARDLTMFVQDQQGDDFRGTPWGRAVHPLWITKQELMKARIIGHNRNASGVPYAWYEGDDFAASKDDELAVADFLQHVRLHEQSHLYLPPGWKVAWFVNEHWAPQAAEIREDINAINGEMLIGFRASMLGLGMIGEGSRAVGDVQEDGYFQVMEGVAKMLCDSLNGTSGGQDHTGVVRRIVDRNLPGYAESKSPYPYVTLGGIRAKKLATFMEGLAKYATAGGIISRRVQDLGYNLLGLDAITDSEWDEAAEGKETTEIDGTATTDTDGNTIEVQTKDDDLPDDEEQLALAAPGVRVPRRPLMPIEELVPLASIESRLNLGVLKYETAVATAIETHADAIGDAGEGSVADLRRAVDRMARELRKDVKRGAVDLYRYGMETVSHERDLQRAVGFDAATATAEATQIAVQKIGRKIALGEDDLKRALDQADDAVLDSAIDAAVEDVRGKVGGTAAAARGARIDVGIAERIAGAVRAMSAAQKRAGGFGLTSIAFNMGRGEFAQTFASEIRSVTISEVLDALTCAPCEGHDQLVVPYGSPEHDAHQPPYLLCEGGLKCRGIEIFDFSGGTRSRGVLG